MNFDPFDQVFVSSSTLADTTANNQFQVNPGGSFGFTNNTLPNTLNASYRLLGEAQSVPEPLTILGTAIALGFGTIFKKKVSQ
ncbi:PEP-CTERM sorting domain-containing protein [Geminocystis sp.]|uniref:PEP-CTERM sorting domain-containing protein n=1 Tax=Geminocystis sp. TaxID=2664100 RepID=UPI00359446F3